MSMRIGKSVESVARRARPYLTPAYRRAFAQLSSRGMDERRPGEPIVCCDFADQAIDAVGGRYYFALVRDLIDAGYFPVFTARRSTLSTFGTSRMKSQLLRERLGVVSSADTLEEPFFLITDNPTAAPPFAEQIILMDYEWRIANKENEIAFPFFMHPRLGTPSARDPTGKREARLFFGGNTEVGKYDKTLIRDTYGILSRREMLDVATRSFAESEIHRPDGAATWLSSSEFHKFVLCETQHCEIPQDRWLEALGKADFFLACPGVGMPLCHNLIEALVAGCIPILQYSSYLSPPLENRFNCLTFEDSEGLREMLDTATSMDRREIAALRENVRNYHNAFLAPGRFSERLFDSSQARKTLLLNSYRVPRPT